MKLVRRFASVGFLTLASVVFGYFGPAARGNAAGASLGAFITKALKEYQVPGAVVAVAQGGKVVWLGHFHMR